MVGQSCEEPPGASSSSDLQPTAPSGTPSPAGLLFSLPQLLLRVAEAEEARRGRGCVHGHGPGAAPADAPSPARSWITLRGGHSLRRLSIAKSTGTLGTFQIRILPEPSSTRICSCMNAPRVGGSFAVWGGLFSAFDCTMVFVRQKEDPWNSIIAGTAIGGFLSMRQGAGAAGRSALMGGALLALIEGAGLMLNRVLATPQNLPPLPADDPNLAAAMAAGGGGIPGLPQAPVSPTEAASSSGGGGWFGGLFGKKEEEKKPSASGGKSEILESFDTPSAPIPSFEYK